MDERQRASLPTITLDKARELRREATDAERRLWQYVRGGQLSGLKFRRQHPIPPYIVDFYCDAAKLVIELDGSQHNEEDDRMRSRFLESRGLTVLRFGNHDVLLETEAVIDAIFNICRTSTPHPNPLPMGEGVQE